MKIAISADGPNLESKVGRKLGTSKYMIIVDVESGDYEAVPNPGFSGQQGSGIQAVLLAVTKDAKKVVTGYCNPGICNQLRANGIEVITGSKGTVGEVIEEYRMSEPGPKMSAGTRLKQGNAKIDKGVLVHATKNSARQFINLVPVLAGVVLLIGLFNTFVTEGFLTAIFSGNMALDTIWGACFGSIFAGNPINSYVIGQELLKYNISLFAVTALIITWVTVGLVQLPAEITALGRRFALLRNGLSFVLSIPIAIITVVVVNLTGW
jgi:predicted Fe-Mo cluster-binding NifX family protein